MKHLKKFNEGLFSSDKGDNKLEEIYDKISDAAYSMQTFGTFNKQASFINGAKWAIHNLTSDDIDYIKKHGDKEDFESQEEEKKFSVLSKEEKEKMMSDALKLSEDQWMKKYPVGDFGDYLRRAIIKWNIN